MRNKNKQYISSMPKYGLGSWLKGAVSDVKDFASNNWTAAISPIAGIGALTSGESANEFTESNAGLIGTGAGAALGMAVGNPMLGAQIGSQIGGGVQQRYQQGIDNQQMLTAQGKAGSRLLGQQRLQQYNNSRGYNYTPTYKHGGILNSYQNGGGVGNINPITQAYAQYEAYKQPADSAMRANFPELNNIIANAPTNKADRVNHMDSAAIANPGMYLKDLSNHLTPEQVSNLESSRKRVVDLTGDNLRGTGPEADAYGVRNVLMPSRANVTRKYDGEIKARYNVGYDPATEGYTRTDIPFKSGGKMYAKGGSTYHAVKANETSGDDPKYPINSASDVKDAWKLRNHAKGLNISQETLNNRIKRQANKYDVDLNTNNKSMGGKLNHYSHRDSTQRDNSLYDIKRAKELGYTKGANGHMPSRDYITGRILKDLQHPTIDKALEYDRKAGYIPYLKDGSAYTNLMEDITNNKDGSFILPPVDIRPKVNAPTSKPFAGGGSIQELTKFNPDITAYQSGGSTHETSPYGGIPLKGVGSVEHGEVRYGDYIFSNRF